MGSVLHGNAEREVDSGTGWISTFFFGLELTSTCMWPESNRKQKGVHRYAGASHRKSENPAKRLQRDLRWTFLSSARLCRELFLKVRLSSSSLHDGSSQYCFGRNTPAAQLSKTRILTDSSIPRTTMNKIPFRRMDGWNDAPWTTDYSQVGREPYQKQIIFMFTPWSHDNLDESYVWWSSVKLIGELGSESLLNHCQNWVRAQDNPSSEDSSAHIHMHI
jgi:hypothetical protein